MQMIALGVTDYGRRYMESGRMLMYLTRHLDLPPEIAYQQYEEWLHLPNHRSKDLTGPRRGQVIQQMLRSARKSIAVLDSRRGRPAQGRLSFNYLDSRFVNSEAGCGPALYSPSPGIGFIPYMHLPTRIRVEVARVLRFLHERAYNGACGALWVSHLELAKVLGKGQISPEELSVLPRTLLDTLDGAKGLVAVVRRLLEEAKVLRKLQSPKKGMRVTQYEVALDRCENVVLLSTDPVADLKSYVQEHNFTQRQLAEELGVKPAHLSMILSGKRGVPNEILWLMSQCASLTPALGGGLASVQSGERVIMARKHRSDLKVVEEYNQEVTSLLEGYEKLIPPKQLVPPVPEHPAIPDVSEVTSQFATEMSESFDRSLLHRTDFGKMIETTEDRILRQVLCTTPNQGPKEQHQLAATLRINANAPLAMYYGLLPILPTFPHKPMPILEPVTDHPEHAQEEARRVLRAYNRIAIQKYPRGFENDPIPQVRLGVLKEQVWANHMKKVLATLAAARVTPERWVAFYLYHFVEHAKEPVTEFPSWAAVFTPALIRSSGHWCNHDALVRDFPAGNRSSREYLPRASRFLAHYQSMIKLLSFAVIPSDSYVQEVIDTYFPDDTFACEAAACFEEYESAKATLEERLAKGEWVWDSQ
jgi:transcriptional regulator with XRE-family HTH domain